MKHLSQLFVLLALLGSGAEALAQEVPSGRFALLAGGRENMGEVGDEFRRGVVFGFEAGYQPGRLGLNWTLMWGTLFYSSDPTSVADELRILEMQFGSRLRWPLGETAPRFLVVATGLSVMRTDIPVPPDDPPSRSYYGPYLGFGLEQLLAGKYMFGLEARYSMLANGPSGLTLVMSLAFGS